MSKRTVVSLSCIAVVVLSILVLKRWGAPRFGLNLNAQIVIFFVILPVVKTVYFVVVDLPDDPPVKPPTP